MQANRTVFEELPMLQFALKQLSLIGLWGACRRQRFKYFAMVTWMVLVLIAPKAILGSGKAGFDSFARNTAELIFFTEVCITVGIFASREGPFRKLVEELHATIERHDSEECLKEIKQFNKRMEMFSKSYAAYIAAMVVLYLGIPIISTAMKCAFSPASNSTDFMLIAELQFYWLDIRRNIVHYAIYVVCCGSAVCCSAYQSTLKGTVIVTCIQYGTKLFELVLIKISCLGDAKEGDERSDQLREIVELHKMALEYTAHLEDTVCFIMINQILSCILIWCLMMFYLSTNFGPNAIAVIILFVVLMGEMVVYCVNGTKLSEKAAAVGHAIYNYPWYLEPVLIQKSIQRIIGRAQRPTGITAAKFYFVDIKRLGLVVQASYSYYLILKDRF